VETGMNPRLKLGFGGIAFFTVEKINFLLLEEEKKIE